MDNKKRHRFTTILYIVILISTLVMLFGTVYAYKVKLHKNDSGEEVVKNIVYLIEYEKGNQINIKNFSPGYSDTYVFSISNNSEDTIGNYELTFDIITPIQNSVDENVVYILEGTSDSFDTTNKVINKSETPVPVNNKKLGQGTITPGSKHTYKLTIKVNNQDVSSLNGKVLAAKINVVNIK